MVSSSTSERLASSSAQKTLKVLILAPGFGASGQPWLYRQVMGMIEFQREVICWKRYNPDLYKAEDVIVHELNTDAAPYDGKGRWLYRLRNAASGNFYAAVGPEKHRLRELIGRFEPDVILCYFGDIAMRVLPIAKHLNIPVVAYFHGDFQFNNNRWYRWSLAKTLSDFAAIVVVTSAEKRWMENRGFPTSKLHVIACGAPTENFFPPAARNENRVSFVMASRMVREKGCDLSIRAFSHVAAKLTNVHLNIYGDGPDRESFQKLSSELGLDSRVTFHGYVGEKVLSRELPLNHIFIQHSLGKEGSPVSIVEAMSCGLPVVASAVGGIADQIDHGKTGFQVAQHDVDSMATGMYQLANDAKLRRAFGEAGRSRALALYNAADLTRQLAQVVAEAAG